MSMSFARSLSVSVNAAVHSQPKGLRKANEQGNNEEWGKNFSVKTLAERGCCSAKGFARHNSTTSAINKQSKGKSGVRKGKITRSQAIVKKCERLLYFHCLNLLGPGNWKEQTESVCQSCKFNDLKLQQPSIH